MDIKEKKCKTKKNEMHARVSRSIKEMLRIYREEANLNGLRICQGCDEQIDLVDQPICREAVEVKPRNLDRRGIYRGSVEKLLRMQKRGFSSEKKHTR